MTVQEQGGYTILVIEDEETSRQLVKIVLQENGYNVLTASDGVEGIDVFKKNKDSIAVVLLDIVLPRLGGWEVLRRMKEIDPDVKSILASAYVNLDTRPEILREAGAVFVQKPYDLNEVMRRIREIIDQPPSKDSC